MERVILFVLGALFWALFVICALLLASGVYYAYVHAGIGEAFIVGLFELPFALIMLEAAN